MSCCLHWIIHNHPLPSVVSLLKNCYSLVTMSAHHLRTSSSHQSRPLMSHDQVELQRILSMTSNGSFHRGSSATMSGSGTHGHGRRPQPRVLIHTRVPGGPPPIQGQPATTPGEGCGMWVYHMGVASCIIVFLYTWAWILSRCH